MKAVRAAVWIVYVPLTLTATWLVMRPLAVLRRLQVLGEKIDTGQLAEYLAHQALPYALLGGLAAYCTASVCLGMSWRKASMFFAELGSIGAAKTIGLLAVIVHARGSGIGRWLGLVALGLAWIFFERRGMWPWRRALRMLAFAVGVFLVVQSAVFAL